jgi:COP9 signalosome complex subunit 6
MHPLVVMSVADHSTRNQLQTEGKVPAIGVVLGTQSSRVISILETFELCIKPAAFESDAAATSGGDAVVNVEDFESDLALFKEAYKEFELLGWYAVCDEVLPVHRAIHRLMQGYNEMPIFVHMTVTTTEKQEELPMKIFRSAIQVRNQASDAAFFEEIPFKIVSDESERVTMVYCARTISHETSENKSAVEQPYRTVIDAATKLRERIGMMYEYLDAVKQQKIQGDPALLRQIKAVCNRVPLMQDNEAFREEVVSNYNDTMLITYLSTLTQTNALAASIDSRLRLLNRGRGDDDMGGMMRGMMRLGGRRKGRDMMY